ncbi:hypothetical protein BDP27DRAFT_1401980 [Rhodocollybia butyracea]|uniref:Uncharacterized protein n=1 Tax=Rhodocollybia butyracea TaxID=206335 RepID=A0A9P5PYE7_9AGAR|nr:hypothetical protein BDP27DRAFT_1401980 [Rhodocollybia butyracea]
MSMLTLRIHFLPISGILAGTYLTYAFMDSRLSPWLPPVSFLGLGLSSWLAAVAFVLTLMLAALWFFTTRHYTESYRAYLIEKKQPLQLDLIRTRPDVFEEYSRGIKSCLFVHAVELYLPILKAAVDWRVLSKEVREEYEKTVQELREQIDLHKSFDNVVVSPACSLRDVLAGRILELMTALAEISYRYACTQRSDQVTLVKIFIHVGEMMGSYIDQ